MKIKKFKAPSFSEALSLVKRELGDDAVILSSEEARGDNRYVEVTAAVDYDAGTTIKQNCTQRENMNRKDELTELKMEVRNIREYIEAMKNSGFYLDMAPDRRRIYLFLKERCIHEEYALRIVQRVKRIEDIETVITDDLTIVRPERSPSLQNNGLREGQRIVMLIGPTGVGKTTTIAKLATLAIREGKRVGLVSLDTFKIGAAEQIRIYSRIIGIPLSIVTDREGLIKTLRRFIDRDLILIDTTGQNPRDPEYINALRDIYESSLPIETHLLLSTSSDGDFLMETHKYYGGLPIDYLVFTKTDEAVKFGSIYNVCRLYQRPVPYITTGQKVPGNIEFVDSKKLTNLILRTGSG